MTDADYSSDPYDPAPYPVPDDNAESAAAKLVCADREEYKADLTDRINSLLDACLFIDTIDKELNDDNDWADFHEHWKNWLHGSDLDVFRRTLKAITHHAQVLAALHRPHPGTPLWPVQQAVHAHPRYQYAIHAATTDGEQLIIGADEPLHTSLHEADLLIKRVLAEPGVASAEVKVRRWMPGDWENPDRIEG